PDARRRRSRRAGTRHPGRPRSARAQLLPKAVKASPCLPGPELLDAPTRRGGCSAGQVVVEEVGEGVLGDLGGEAVPGQVVVVVGEGELDELVGYACLV